MTTVSPASPLGFSPEWKSYKDKIKLRLHELESAVLDPWEGPFHSVIAAAGAIQDWPSRARAFKEIGVSIGEANENIIRSCDIVLGVLAGAETDSGTVSELG